MKKILVMLTMLISVSVFGGAVDNNNNFSAEYARTLTRNAATDSADIAVYNPAGLTRLVDGVYLNIGNQFVLREYSHSFINPLNPTAGKVSFKSDIPTLLLPSAFAVYKKGDWAGYFAFVIPSGGGKLEYEKGVASTAASALDAMKPKVEGFSAYYSGILGITHNISKIFSISGGVRYVFAETSAKIIATLPAESTVLNYETTASGFGLVFGANIKPVECVNIAFRYEERVALRWNTDKSDNPNSIPGYSVKGEKFERDLPAIISLGVAYQPISPLKLETNLNLYFNQQANWDSNKQDQFDNGLEVAFSAEYAIIPMLKASAGFLYSNTGADSSSYYYLKPALDSKTVALGFLVTPIDKLDINLGVMKTFYDSDIFKTEPINLDLEKELLIIALGVQYRF